MASVYAFQPRSIDPPRFVSEDSAELYDRIGEYIGGDQCDGCGNSCYRIGAVMGHRWIATCCNDPQGDPEFKHPDPCGAVYTIRLWDEDLVCF